MRTPWRTGVALSFLAAATAARAGPPPDHFASILGHYSGDVECSGPGATATKNGVPVACGEAVDLRNVDTGIVQGVATESVDSELSGTLGVGFDGYTVTEGHVDLTAQVGALRGVITGHVQEYGAYVYAGGDGVPGRSTAEYALAWHDELTVHGPGEGMPVQIRFGQAVHRETQVGFLPATPCPVNGSADEQLSASLYVTDPGGENDLVQFQETELACLSGNITGSPRMSFVLSFPDGAGVTMSGSLNLFADAHFFGSVQPQYPNRVHEVSTLIDAGNTAVTWIEVLTPGGGYDAASGLVYPAPEAPAAAGAFASIAILGTMRGRRRPH